MTTPRCLTVLLSSLPLFAQTAPPPAPADAPQVVIETVGPEGWRARLGPTNVGTLLASEPGQALWRPRLVPLLESWQQIVGDADAFAPVRDRLLGYAGRVRIGMWLRPDGRGEVDEMQTALVIEGDGKSDLAALAKDLRQLQAAAPGQWQPRDGGDVQFEVCDQGFGVMSGPITGTQCLLLVAATGDHFDQALSRARRFAADCTGKAPPLSLPALRVVIDVPALLNAQDAVRPKERESRTAVGLDSLGALTMTLGAAGPHLQLEIDQHFRSNQRGLFGVLCSAATELPRLLPLAASGKGSWHAGHLDLTTLHDTVLAALGVEMRETPDELRAAMKKEFGIDVRDDLLAHASDTMLFTLAPFTELDDPREVTWTMAFELRDEAAFAKALWQMMGHAKPMLSRAETVGVDGVDLHRYGNMFGYDLWLGVGNGIVAFGCGRDAEERLSAQLRAAKAIDRSVAPALPATFAAVQRRAPGGTNAAAIADLDGLLSMPIDWSLMLLREFVRLPRGGDGDHTEEQVAAARALLRDNHLDTVRSLTGYADDHFRWRLFW